MSGGTDAFGWAGSEAYAALMQRWSEALREAGREVFFKPADAPRGQVETGVEDEDFGCRVCGGDGQPDTGLVRAGHRSLRSLC